MKTVVIYISKKGSTANAAKLLAEQLDATLVNLDKEQPDLATCETVVIGGPVFAGSLPGNLKKFCTDNQEVLLSKRLGLFNCCGNEGEEADKQLEKAFPPELFAHASHKAVLGGAVILEQHNFFIRALLKKVGIKESFSRLYEDRVAAMAEALRT